MPVTFSDLLVYLANSLKLKFLLIGKVRNVGSKKPKGQKFMDKLIETIISSKKDVISQVISSKDAVISSKDNIIMTQVSMI